MPTKKFKKNFLNTSRRSPQLLKLKIYATLGSICARGNCEKLTRVQSKKSGTTSRKLTGTLSGNLAYRFKKPWDDGTTALKLTPMELMERLVALVPRPRVHLTRYHGVLGPHYKYRSQIVPKAAPELKAIEPEQVPEQASDTQLKPQEEKKKNIPWARLLARVFNIDVETCTKCGAKMKIIAAIEEPKVIRKILEHLGLDTKPPPLQPARGPPQQQHHFEEEPSEEDFHQQHFEMNFDSFNESAD